MSTPQAVSLESFDEQIEAARQTAITLATKAKSLNVKLRDLLLASTDGTDAAARKLHREVADATADQTLEELRLSTLLERRGRIADEIEANRARAEAQAKRDAFKALIDKRTQAAADAADAIKRLGDAIRELTAANTEATLALPTVGLPTNVIYREEVRDAVNGELHPAVPWLFPDNPRLDAQGKPMAGMARITKSGADILAMLPKAA